MSRKTPEPLSRYHVSETRFLTCALELSPPGIEPSDTRFLTCALERDFLAQAM